MSDYTYIGSELNVFNLATNWKSYYHELIADYIGREVLEVGAGIGATTETLCVRDDHVRWVCLEPDARLAESVSDLIASKRLPSCCLMRVGTVADLAPEDLYDTILYIDVLEHIEDDRQEAYTAAQHLKPGGHLVVLAPAHQKLYTPFDAAIGHFRRYDKRTLAAAIPGDLKQRALFYVDAVGALASTGNKLILKSGTPNAQQITFWDKVLIPLSRKVDPLLRYRVGKSIIGVWQRDLQ
ncbi:MAG: class I SAM-dependent methyltransferase [Pyrinomonadaceae bacterium]